MSDRDSQHSPVRSIRWWPILLIGLIGCGIFIAVQVCGWNLIRPAIDIQIFVSSGYG